MNDLIASVKASLRSIAPFEWLEEVLEAGRPLQDYNNDCIMLQLIECLMQPEDHPQHEELKALFLACCSRLWEDNAAQL